MGWWKNYERSNNYISDEQKGGERTNSRKMRENEGKERTNSKEKWERMRREKLITMIDERKNNGKNDKRERNVREKKR